MSSIATTRSMPIITPTSKYIGPTYVQTNMKDISKKVKPIGDRVIIREHIDNKERKTASGIIIPVTGNEDKGSKRGEVVAVGPGRTEEGKIIPIMVKPGDTVFFLWGDKIAVDSEEYYIVRESEILAVIK
jgi:chaperonin GroES